MSDSKDREGWARLIPYQNEDTELMRDMASQRCEQLNAIASAEEVGYARGLKEYTKLEEEIERLKNEAAAARKQGFEEGKQATLKVAAGEEVRQQIETAIREAHKAGRDEVLKELSEQEPVAYEGKQQHHNWAAGGEKYYWDKKSGLHRHTVDLKDVVPLIPRPTAPITKE